MNPELYKLLMLYKNKEIDDNFIYNAFDIMMKYDMISKYINDFYIVDQNDDALGSFSNEERVIKINKTGLLTDETVKNKKLLTLQVIRHELEHAKNLQRLYERYNDIETKVIRYSLREYAMNNNLYYGNTLDKVNPLVLRVRKFGTYDIDPGERIAEIKSWKFMVNLLKSQRVTDDLLTARIMLYCSYIRGYNDNGFYLEPPTYEFLLAMGLYNEHYLLKKQFKKKDYCLDTRLLYGLPISKEEYNQEILKKVRIKKKEKVK